ncbi:secreted antigen 1 [Babesia divergens]|uniref:Secreted antigen 1 n=1 Tax=Babesia divergens TaxID=32595 RepID=A0AAD9G5G4_BABDI|nr:secreted antigen 1 [Babesia divergens]
MTDQESQACNFEDPGSLKDILELLEKLNDASSLKKSVGQKLVQDVKKYFKDTDQFYKDSRSSGFLSTVFSNAYGIRSTILKNSRTYDKYKNLNDGAHESHEDQECGEKISEALKKCLPKAFSVLFFLYFMGSNRLGDISGGAWKNQNVDGSGRSGQKLYQWLTDNRLVTPGLIRRGFLDSELNNSNNGSTVAPLIKQIIKHDSAGALQKALCYMLFVCPWHDALTGHACLFLHKFCDKVTGGKSLEESFKKICSNVSFDDLKEVCKNLKENLNPFVSGTSSGLRAVSQQSTSNLFEDLWDESKFEAYCGLLKTILKDLKKSLEKMSQESSAWNPSALSNASTAGPFKYGFIFGNSGWERDIKNRLEGPLGKLLSSLESLDDCVNDRVSSSAGATAGGVFTGLFGLGGAGAGAAYGLNLFGFKNFISGLISSFFK